MEKHKNSGVNNMIMKNEQKEQKYRWNHLSMMIMKSEWTNESQNDEVKEGEVYSYFVYLSSILSTMWYIKTLFYFLTYFLQIKICSENIDMKHRWRFWKKYKYNQREFAYTSLRG